MDGERDARARLAAAAAAGIAVPVVRTLVPPWAFVERAAYIKALHDAWQAHIPWWALWPYRFWCWRQARRRTRKSMIWLT